MLKLTDIMADWVGSLNINLNCVGDKIITPCYCGSILRMALIYDNYVHLVNANCKCGDCTRTDISASDPTFFSLVEKSLRSRIVHESVNVSNIVHPGDDIQHAIDHYSGAGGEIKIGAGVYTLENLNLKDVQIILSGEADFNNCQFNNITKPIQSTFDTSFVSCGFYASKDQPPDSFMNLNVNSYIIGNTFYGA